MARTPEEPQQLIQDRMASRKSDIINLHPGDPSATITIREQDCLIFGLPHTSIYFGPNTFMIDRDSEDPWLKAPEKADILISHSPPMGFHDKNLNGKHQGCGRLKGAILRIKSRLVGEGGSTEVVNAAVMDRLKNIAWEAQTAMI
ncbi:MAG: hypothetical protein MMC33_005458 [Icmadophila ericetorum]|nr:hypothetical protein [Icmadophila ericetorum]